MKVSHHDAIADDGHRIALRLYRPELSPGPRAPAPDAGRGLLRDGPLGGGSRDGAGLDPARIAVMGGSAGGGLAAGVTLLARDQGGPAIARQLLVYPMLDDRTRAADPQMAHALLWSVDDKRDRLGRAARRARSATAVCGSSAIPD